MKKGNPDQLCLFAWAEAKPSNVIDVTKIIIRRIALEPWPPKQKGGELVPLKRSVA